MPKAYFQCPACKRGFSTDVRLAAGEVPMAECKCSVPAVDMTFRGYGHEGRDHWPHGRRANGPPSGSPKRAKVPERRLNDDDVMFWGKYEGRKLAHIPDDYWRWFLKQNWCDKHPRLVEYANLVIED